MSLSPMPFVNPSAGPSARSAVTPPPLPPQAMSWGGMPPPMPLPVGAFPAQPSSPGRIILIVLCLVTGLFLGLLCVGGVMLERAYATEGKKVVATVLDQRTADAGRKRLGGQSQNLYVEYSYRDAAGRRHVREEAVPVELFNTLSTGSVLTAEYLPDSPALGRLVMDRDNNDLTGYGIGTVLLVGVAIWRWRAGRRRVA